MEKPGETLVLKAPLILDVGLREIIVKMTKGLSDHWLTYIVLCRLPGKKRQHWT